MPQRSPSNWEEMRCGDFQLTTKGRFAVCDLRCLYATFREPVRGAGAHGAPKASGYYARTFRTGFLARMTICGPRRRELNA